MKVDKTDYEKRIAD
jgi:hypothetical protein